MLRGEQNPLFYIDSDGNIQTINRSMKIGSTNKIYFRDSTMYCHSPVDGELNIVSDSYIGVLAPYVKINEYLTHEGDTDTYIRYVTDDLQFVAGNLMSIHINGTGVGFFTGTTPQAQQAHIVDADGTIGDITTKFNTLLADLEGYGLLASA